MTWLWNLAWGDDGMKKEETGRQLYNDAGVAWIVSSRMETQQVSSNAELRKFYYVQHRGRRLKVASDWNYLAGGRHRGCFYTHCSITPKYSDLHTLPTFT